MMLECHVPTQPDRPMTASPICVVHPPCDTCTRGNRGERQRVGDRKSPSRVRRLQASRCVRPRLTFHMPPSRVSCLRRRPSIEARCPRRVGYRAGRSMKHVRALRGTHLHQRERHLSTPSGPGVSRPSGHARVAGRSVMAVAAGNTAPSMGAAAVWPLSPGSTWSRPCDTNASSVAPKRRSVGGWRNSAAQVNSSEPKPERYRCSWHVGPRIDRELGTRWRKLGGSLKFPAYCARGAQESATAESPHTCALLVRAPTVSARTLYREVFLGGPCAAMGWPAQDTTTLPVGPSSSRPAASDAKTGRAITAAALPSPFAVMSSVLILREDAAQRWCDPAERFTATSGL